MIKMYVVDKVVELKKKGNLFLIYFFCIKNLYSIFIFCRIVLLIFIKVFLKWKYFSCFLDILFLNDKYVIMF